MYVFQPLHPPEQSGSDFLARTVLVIHDAVFTVSALSGIEEIPLLVPRKPHARTEQIGDRLPRGTKHAVHRIWIVFKVPRAHRVPKISVVIPVPFQNAYSALREIGIAVAGALFGNQQNFFVPRQKQRRIQARNARAHDDDVVLSFQLSARFVVFPVRYFVFFALHVRHISFVLFFRLLPKRFFQFLS